MEKKNEYLTLPILSQGTHTHSSTLARALTRTLYHARVHTHSLPRTCTRARRHPLLAEERGDSGGRRRCGSGVLSAGCPRSRARARRGKAAPELGRAGQGCKAFVAGEGEIHAPCADASFGGERAFLFPAACSVSLARQGGGETEEGGRVVT